MKMAGDAAEEHLSSLTIGKKGYVKTHEKYYSL